MRNKKKMDETDDVMNHNIDLWSKLKEKPEKLMDAEESYKMAEGLAALSAQKHVRGKGCFGCYFFEG